MTTEEIVDGMIEFLNKEEDFILKTILKDITDANKIKLTYVFKALDTKKSVPDL